MRIPKLCDSIYNVDLLLSRRLNAFPALLILMIVLKIARLERLKNSCKLVGIYICLMPANALINHMMSPNTILIPTPKYPPTQNHTNSKTGTFFVVSSILIRHLPEWRIFALRHTLTVNSQTLNASLRTSTI